MVSVVINYPHIENLGDFLRLILMSLIKQNINKTKYYMSLAPYLLLQIVVSSQKVLILRINTDPMD